MSHLPHSITQESDALVVSFQDRRGPFLLLLLAVPLMVAGFLVGAWVGVVFAVVLAAVGSIVSVAAFRRLSDQAVAIRPEDVELRSPQGVVRLPWESIAAIEIHPDGFPVHRIEFKDRAGRRLGSTAGIKPSHAMSEFVEQAQWHLPEGGTIEEVRSRYTGLMKGAAWVLLTAGVAAAGVLPASSSAFDQTVLNSARPYALSAVILGVVLMNFAHKKLLRWRQEEAEVEEVVLTDYLEGRHVPGDAQFRYPYSKTAPALPSWGQLAGITALIAFMALSALPFAAQSNSLVLIGLKVMLGLVALLLGALLVTTVQFRRRMIRLLAQSGSALEHADGQWYVVAGDQKLPATLGEVRHHPASRQASSGLLAASMTVRTAAGDMLFDPNCMVKAAGAKRRNDLA